MNPTKSRLQILIDEFERIVRGLVIALVAKQITLSQFDTAMRLEIKSHHLAAAALANNGILPTDTAHIQVVIDAQMKYFDRWMSGLYLGRQSPTGLAALLEQYTQEEQSRRSSDETSNDNGLPALIAGVGLAITSLAARNTLKPENVTALAARAASYSAAANETTARQQAASLGLPPLPFYKADRTQCHANCLCDWRFVTLAGNGNWDVYWTLNVTGVTTEHCPTCLARERAANPLRVRNGAILDASKYQAGNLYA